jgi:hypothetical protein
MKLSVQTGGQDERPGGIREWLLFKSGRDLLA